ncbi:MAG: DUF2461 domain-containing protein [Flavobacteriaceae bacterium]|jgi:uncharacterized protein (TIGR02453 family)|nr:DUF2461 domain-containing protein [Flavobacteriaceae bacterium]
MSSLPKELFSFFKKLEKNNNREWFNDNKPQFKNIESQVKVFGENLKNALESSEKVDEFKLFRVYRDVRFSKNKTPYKTHFGLSFHREKPEFRGGYYVHLKPNDNFIAVGFWNPNKEDLLRIRKELELDSSEFRELMEVPKFKNVWGLLEGEELKTAPKGFSKEDPNIDLIRKKMFLFKKKYTDTEVLASNFIDKVAQDFITVRPFLDYMSSVLTTDLNGVSLLEK